MNERQEPRTLFKGAHVPVTREVGTPIVSRRMHARVHVPAQPTRIATLT